MIKTNNFHFIFEQQQSAILAKEKVLYLNLARTEMFDNA